MRKSKFSEGQIVGILKEAKAAVSLDELSRQHGFSKATYYKWRPQYGGMEVSAKKRLKELMTELSLENAILKETVQGNFEVQTGVRNRI